MPKRINENIKVVLSFRHVDGNDGDDGVNVFSPALLSVFVSCRVDCASLDSADKRTATPFKTK